MSENKVTNYSISKRLAELKFDCESHTGWWVDKLALVRRGDPKLEGRSDWQWVDGTEVLDILFKKPTTWQASHPSIKAYSCWDLLEALRRKMLPTPQTADSRKFYKLWIHPSYYEVSEQGRGYEEQYGEEDTNPANALGLACIKILEENDGQDK